MSSTVGFSRVGAPPLLVRVRRVDSAGILCGDTDLDDRAGFAVPDQVWPGAGLARIWLRSAPGLDPPPPAEAAVTRAWLAGDPDRTREQRWLLTAWERAGIHHETLWATVDPAGSAEDIIAAAAGLLRDQLPAGADADWPSVLAALDPPADPLSALTDVLVAGGGEPHLLAADGPLGFRMGAAPSPDPDPDSGPVWDCLAETADGWLVVYVCLPIEVDGPVVIGALNGELQVGCLVADADGTVLYRAATDTALRSAFALAAALRRLLDLVRREVTAILATGPVEPEPTEPD